MDQVTSGDKRSIRPGEPENWTPSNLVPAVTVTLSEEPEEPTYLDTVTVTAVDNVEEVQIRIVRIFDGPEELVLSDKVSLKLFNVDVVTKLMKP